MKKENGIISLVVLFVMLFLLIFVLTVFSIVRDKAKIQNTKEIELKQIYSKNENEVEMNLYAESDSIIPIYNVNELKSIGTGSYIDIKGKIYQCGINKNYELKNNIIIDVNEDLKSTISDFNDYKFYLDNYNINKSIYDIYYFYDNSYWKVIAYQKFNENKELIDKDICESYKFSILNQLNFQNFDLEFVNIIKNEKGEIISIYQEKQVNIPQKLENINVFKNHISELDMEKSEFYILIKSKDKI